MTIVTYPKALCGFAVVFVGIATHGFAQEAGLALTCSGGADCPPPPIVIAQTGGPAMGQIGVVQTGGMAFAVTEGADVVKNQPYQAQAVTEMKQTLADGSHITQTTTATVARDSDGRTVRIQKLSTIGPWKSASDSSQANGLTLTTIFDPVAKTHTDFTSDSKVARVLPLPTPPSGSASGAVARFEIAPGDGMPVTAGAAVGSMSFAVQGRADSSPSPNSLDFKTEALGTKTIDGISVEGTRTTNTLPAGTIGNDKDLLTIRETWYSPDLKLVVQSTQTDPRFGETTYTLKDIQRSEPDPALFQVPAGYKVEKVPAPGQPN
ncbi:MAG TPA: hypothetical protein VFB43_06925 [Terracidiphilus sp.]|nr:hypothetical protein [Terracidiphilus sp.]